MRRGCIIIAIIVVILAVFAIVGSLSMLRSGVQPAASGSNSKALAPESPKT